MKIFLIIISVILIFILITAISFFVKNNNRPKLGVENGELTEPPKSPNCVSTQAVDTEHSIEPIETDLEMAELINNTKTIIENMEGVVIEENSNYIRAEFKTKIMKFIDDVEFYYDEENTTLHFRSASRVGYSDMGVNRERMETFRKQFLEDN